LTVTSSNLPSSFITGLMSRVFTWLVAAARIVESRAPFTPRLWKAPGLCGALHAALIGVLAAAGPVHAQVNTEKMRALDVDGFRTTVGADIAWQSGNSDLFEVGARARFDYRTGRQYAFFVGEARYGEEDGKAFRDRSFGHLRYNRELRPWLVAEAFSQVENNGFARLQLRVLAGIGIRMRVVDTGRFKLFQGTTPMFEYENLESSGLVRHPATMSTVRWSNYVNLRLRLTEKTQVLTTVYVQPRVDDLGDLRILDEATLAVALTEHVTLAVSFNLGYDSRPPDGVNDLDLSLRNGIAVTF